MSPSCNSTVGVAEDSLHPDSKHAATNAAATERAMFDE